MRLATRHIILLAMLLRGVCLFGQDLENIGEQKALDYSGGVGVNTTFYDARGIDNRRDPFFWQLNANVNFSILGIIQAPFSMSISQQNKNFSQPQPFNRLGISPTYKDYTLHLGHRSMTFSNYTLSGNLFFGVGAEYQPKSNPLRVSALYGRFAKPVARSAQRGVTFAVPTFRRVGYGTKVGYEKGGQEAHVIIFRANDDPNSIPLSDSLDIRPQQNLVLGFVTSLKLLRSFTFKTDYAYSLFSRNASSPEAFIDDFTFVNNLGGLFTPTTSSNYTTAFTSSLAYNGDGFQINGQYRRVDPEYTTLGSSFLNNDIEDISAGISMPLFHQKVTLSTNAGVQRNNLDNQLTANLRRFIFSASASWIASQELQLVASYGNYNSSTRQVQIQTNVLEDTLEFFQVSRNGSLNVNYTLGQEKDPLLLSWTGSVQDASDSQDQTSTFISNLLSAQKRLRDWSVSFAASANRNQTDQFENLTAGPVFSLSRSFDKGKYRTSFSSSLLNVYVNQELESTVTNFRWTASMKAGEKHSFSLNAFYVTRRSKEEPSDKNIREIRASINYSFRI